MSFCVEGTDFFEHMLQCFNQEENFYLVSIYKKFDHFECLDGLTVEKTGTIVTEPKLSFYIPPYILVGNPACKNVPSPSWFDVESEEVMKMKILKCFRRARGKWVSEEVGVEEVGEVKEKLTTLKNSIMRQE